jgi:hypothetical protein
MMPRSREDVLIIDPVILNLAVALGIGLLIGAERGSFHLFSVVRRRGLFPHRTRPDRFAQDSA